MGFETAILGAASVFGSIGSTVGAMSSVLAPIGSLFSGITAASSLLGIGGDKSSAKPTMPAAPAAAPRETGANVQLGTNERIYRALAKRKPDTTNRDILSGLGRGGLSI